MSIMLLVLQSVCRAATTLAAIAVMIGVQMPSAGVAVAATGTTAAGNRSTSPLPNVSWMDCRSCRSRTEWERHIAGYDLVMLSAVPAATAPLSGNGNARAETVLRQRFELRRGGEIMLDIEDRWLDPARSGDLRLPPPGTDVAGTGRPQVVLMGWTGEDDCCFTLHIVELGPEPRILARIAPRAGVPRLVQRDADPDFEILVEDATYTLWGQAPASVLPRVVLKYDPQAGHYRFAVAEMHAPPPPITRLETEAHLLGEAAEAAPADHVPPHLLRTMLRLIYAGNYPMARRFLDDAWSTKFGTDRETFLKDLMECRLPESPYWVDVAAMNGLTPAAPRADCRSQ